MVRSQDPASVLNRVLAIQSLAGYQLVPKTPRAMRDVYFETVEGSLKRRRLNLRVRGVGGAYWVTLKRNPGLFFWKRNERQEIELPWSQDSFAQIVGELSRLGVGLEKENPTDLSSPVEVMKRVGFRVLQDRETLRTVIEIMGKTGRGEEVLAEVALDSVLYHFQGQDLRLYELEVEAKSRRGRGTLGPMVDALTGLLEPELQKWRFGKLATGRAIERLLSQGSLKGLVENEKLKPEAYDIVLEALKSR